MSRRARHLNPANLGCQVALDARFETAYANGVAVDTWTGRPGTSVNATATATQRPLFTTNSINGQPALTFDGSNDVMALNATTLFSGVQHGCMISVCRDDDTTTGDSSHNVIFYSTSNANAAFATANTRISGSANFAASGRRLNADTFATSGTIASASAPTVLSGIYAWGIGTLAVRANGVQSTNGNYSSGAGTTTAGTSTGVSIGAQNSTTSRFPGVIAVVIATNIDLGTANLKRIEQAIARAFNLTCA